MKSSTKENFRQEKRKQEDFFLPLFFHRSRLTLFFARTKTFCAYFFIGSLPHETSRDIRGGKKYNQILVEEKKTNKTESDFYWAPNLAAFHPFSFFIVLKSDENPSLSMCLSHKQQVDTFSFVSFSVSTSVSITCLLIDTWE